MFHVRYILYDLAFRERQLAVHDKMLCMNILASNDRLQTALECSYLDHLIQLINAWIFSTIHPVYSHSLIMKLSTCSLLEIGNVPSFQLPVKFWYQTLKSGEKNLKDLDKILINASFAMTYIIQIDLDIEMTMTHLLTKIFLQTL